MALEAGETGQTGIDKAERSINELYNPRDAASSLSFIQSLAAEGKINEDGYLRLLLKLSDKSELQAQEFSGHTGDHIDASQRQLEVTGLRGISSESRGYVAHIVSDRFSKSRKS